MQLLAHQLGGKVAPAGKREYGPASVRIEERARLFDDLPTELPVWMSHGDTILEAPPGFRRLAESENSTIAAMADESGRFGIAFHPEVIHTPQGREILRNFLYQDRKSTRLNSSHLVISYAVFCLKKKQ